MESGLRAEAEEAGRLWWVFLLAGIAWLLFAWIVLTVDADTVVAIGIFAGVAFMAGGFNEFLRAGLVDRWRWLHILFGVLFLVTGLAALVWPSRTFLILAAIVGWYLLFLGMLHIIVAFADRTVELWWLPLVVGIVEVLIGFWAVGYPGRSAVLLIVWIGAAALARGIVEIVLAFQIRGVRRQLA